MDVNINKIEIAINFNCVRMYVCTIYMLYVILSVYIHKVLLPFSSEAHEICVGTVILERISDCDFQCQQQQEQ